VKRFLVTYKKKNGQPAPGGIVSSQLLEAKEPKDIYPRLFERLHVKEEEFRVQYEVVDIKEM
jgi:hypothetical protein